MALKQYVITIEVDENQLERMEYTSTEAGVTAEIEGAISSAGEGISFVSLKESVTLGPELPFPNEDPKDVWDFVTKYYPDYDHSDEIGWEGDLHKLVEKEYEEGDCADELLKSEYGGDIDNAQIYTDWKASNQDILQKAIEGYIESLKNKK